VLVVDFVCWVGVLIFLRKGEGFFFHYKFLLGYIHHMGGFIVTILVRLTMYISYTAPSGEDVFKS
jgi:hypothetical protein